MTRAWFTLLAMAILAACHRTTKEPAQRQATAAPGSDFVVAESTVVAGFDAAGTAEPVERATLSTKLMGGVTQVLVQEGDRVTRGQLLARIDARDVEAKRAQVAATISGAEAMYKDAETQAARFRALYADSAATRYQLDQVETGLARAQAGLETAQASQQELDAVAAYSEIRAPFAGIITRRFVDPGALAAPGAPLFEIQDGSRLRVSVTVPPRVAGALRRGHALRVDIEGREARGTVEGVVPAPAGAVYTVNVLVDNRAGGLLSGGAATIRVPDGTRQAILIPASAVIREGDLTGVRVRGGSGSELRWVRLGTSCPMTGGACQAVGPGASPGPTVEVLSGLRPGDLVLVGGE
jgi:RND family efflux transporter MFP subunit